MALYNRRIGTRISSVAMKATAIDSLSDVVATTVVLIGTIVSAASGIIIDGYCGVLVGMFILYSGFVAAKDTISPLLGQPPEPELVQQINDIVLSYDNVIGIHDLIVHNYGPGRSMASIHAEVPNDQEIEKSHEIIDRVERDAAKELGMMLVIHMDPVEMKDEKVIRIRKKTEHLLKELDPACSIHDFRVVWGAERINLIFDMVIPIEYDEKRRNDLPLQLMERLKGVDSRYESVITVDYDYVAKTEDK